MWKLPRRPTMLIAETRPGQVYDNFESRWVPVEECPAEHQLQALRAVQRLRYTTREQVVHLGPTWWTVEESLPTQIRILGGVERIWNRRRTAYGIPGLPGWYRGTGNNSLMSREVARCDGLYFCTWLLWTLIRLLEAYWYRLQHWAYSRELHHQGR